MAVEDTRILVVEDCRLDSALEERLWLAHEVLVERVLARDEDCEAVPTPAGASPLLPQACDRSGETERDRAVEQADVDAELERVGRAHTEQVAVHEPPLEFAALSRRVASAVRSEPSRQGGVVEPLGGESMDELRCPAALGEADSSQPARDEIRHHPRRLPERARPEAELLVGERRVPERDRALGARGAVVVDDGRFDARERLHELTGVRDRRRREQQLRLGAVHGREPAQPAQDVGDV
jgi:hypothetical protein